MAAFPMPNRIGLFAHKSQDTITTNFSETTSCKHVHLKIKNFHVFSVISARFCVTGAAAGIRLKPAALLASLHNKVAPLKKNSFYRFCVLNTMILALIKHFLNFIDLIYA